MKILITGANGYIGSQVVKYLCDLNMDVIAVDVQNDHIDSRAIYIKKNIFTLENENLYELFEEPDICLHLAWRDGFQHNSDKHMQDLSFHFCFLQNLVINGLKNLAIMGSMHEIGYWEGAVTETTPCHPTNFYGIAKNCLRDASKILCQNHNCTWKWLRGYYIYGNDDFGASVFCKINKAYKNGDKEFNLTNGTNKFDFISVNELTRMISACILQNEINGIINISSGEPVSLREEILKYVEVNNINLKLNRGVFPERESESPCIYGDNSKIAQIMKKFDLEKKLN